MTCIFFVFQVRRDGRPTAIQAATSTMTSGSYTIFVSAPSHIPGALPETGTFIKSFPIDCK